MRALLGKILVVALALAIAGTMAVAPAAAAPTGSVTIDSVWAWNCAGGQNGVFASVTSSTGSFYGYAEAKNLRTGDTAFFNWGPIPTPYLNQAFNTVPLPAGQAGDVIQFTIFTFFDAGLTQPLGTASIAFNCSTGAIVILPSLCADGRLNDDACAGPAALYCTDNGLEVWDIDADGVGTLAFTFSGSFETPTTNSLLMQAGDVQLWQLDTGEFQVNADAGEGKTYAFIFNGCPYDGAGYNANIDPNE